MVQELEERIHELEGSINSIYFGGGTPSLLTHEELNCFFEAIKHYDAVEEITLEVNPEDLTESKLASLGKIRGKPLEYWDTKPK